MSISINRTPINSVAAQQYAARRRVAASAATPQPRVASATSPASPSAPQGVGGTDAMARYRTLAPANEAKPPVGFERFGYGTNPNAALVPTPANRPDLAGGIGTPPEVAKLYEAGAANAFSPEYRAILDKAIEANGGLGDAEHGYLAFSREYGFVRYRNPNFTPEQNRKLAAMSLQAGWPLERLPSRKFESSTMDDPKMNAWVEEFTAKYAEKFEAFAADPSKGLELKDGSRNRYYLAFDQASGRVFSQTARLKGGFAGFVQKHMKILGPVLSVAQVIAAPFAPYVSAGIQMLKTGLNTLITGKFGASGALSVLAAIPGVGSWFQANPIAGAVAGSVANGVDTGRFNVGSVLNAVGAQYLNGLPGGELVDQGAQAVLNLIGKKIDGQKIDLAGLAKEFGPVLKLIGKEMTGEDFTRTITNAIGADPKNTESWIGRLGDLIKDKETRDAVATGARVLYDLVRSGRISPDESARLVEQIGIHILAQTEWGRQQLAEQAARQQADARRAA